MLKRIISGYRHWRPFTDSEAWMLFKLAAFAEAIGWTLLIIGIFLTENVFNSRVPVVLAGRTHGILFGLYITAVLLLSPSLRWGWKRTIIAGLMSVPPFGSLAFEIWTSHTRRRKSIQRLGYFISYQQLTLKTK
jgi:integral membrane protein